MARFKRKYFLLTILLNFTFSATVAWPQEKEIELSLNEVTRLAILNNFDIQLAQYDAKIAQTKQGVAESIYDTIFEAEVKYRNNQRGRTSTISGTKTLENDYNLGLTRKLPTGTTVELDMTNARDWTTSTFATRNPSHDSALSVTIEQELGKNFFGLKDRGAIKVTKLDIENTGYTSFAKIEQSIAQVQKAYWELVLYLNRVQVEEQMLDQAQKLFELHHEKFKDGLVETVELVAVEANAQERRNELLLAQNEALVKENVLRLLLNITDDEIRLSPTETFQPDEESDPENLEYSLRQAFEHRFDYKKSRTDIEARNIELAMKKNDLWPEINLEASFARNGIGDHFDKAVTNITAEDNPDLFLGATIRFPLENTEARAKFKGAEMEKARAILELKRIERTIAVEIMDQVRSCNVFKNISDNSQAIAQLQERKFLEEEKRFLSGRSSTDTVIRFQEDVLQARWQALQDQYQFYAARIDLRRKEGTLLKEYWE